MQDNVEMVVVAVESRSTYGAQVASEWSRRRGTRLTFYLQLAHLPTPICSGPVHISALTTGE